jgi:hypothetical protein
MRPIGFIYVGLRPVYATSRSHKLNLDEDSPLFVYSLPLAEGCQTLRTTLPKGRPSTR